MKALSSIVLLLLVVLAHSQGYYNCSRGTNSYGNGYISSGSGYNSGGYINGNNHNCRTPMDEDLRQIIIGVSVALIIIGMGLGGIFIWRLVARRNLANKIRDQMRVRKMNFASQNGLNLYEVNNYQTIHL